MEWLWLAWILDLGGVPGFPCVVGENLLGWSQGGFMAHLRVARPTDDLETLARMYAEGLGLSVVGEFRDHDGFDGIILGRPGLGYQLEFTRQAGHTAGRAPTKDNLLVFYHPERADWEASCARMTEAGFTSVKSWNPYWDDAGRTFEDSDGYRVVIQMATAPGEEAPDV